MIGTCRHCKASRDIRARGLCWPCHRTPSILGKYPRQYSEADTSVPGKRAPRPTRYGPGTSGKVNQMMRRVQFGFKLYHPDDAGQREFDRRSTRKARIFALALAVAEVA